MTSQDPEVPGTMGGPDPTSDPVYALACSPSFASDGVCYAGRGSGLYRSSDRGATWHLLPGIWASQSAVPITAIAQPSSHPSGAWLFAGVPGGVMRSWDGGQTWQLAALPGPPPAVVALAVSPGFEQDGVLFAGTAEDGVYHSANRGSTWVAWNFGLLDLGIICMLVSPGFVADERVLVGTESGIYHSTNGGRAWRPLNFSVDSAPVLSLALSPDFTSDGTIYAGTEACGLWRSADLGESWERLAGVRIRQEVNGILVARGRSGQHDLLVLTADGLLLSRDGEDSWLDLAAELPTEEGATCLAAPLGLDPGRPLFVGLTDGAVLGLDLPASAAG